MAVKILTVEEAEKTKKLAEEYGEFYFEKRGLACGDYLCDLSGKEIKKGFECVAVVILRTENHPNKDHQIAMLDQYVDEVKS